MASWIVAVLVVVFLLPACLVLWLFVPLRPISIGKLFPDPPGGKGWFAGKLDGVPFLVENGLVYPCSFSSTGRKMLSLDGDWQLRFDPEGLAFERIASDEAQWQPVSVPAVYNAAEGGRTDYLGIVWYRKEFVFDEDIVGGESARLCFHGVLLRGKLWLNGNYVGSFEGGYTPHYFDISPFLEEDNILIVMTDNRLTETSLPMKTMEGHNPGWHTYGGIYRSVDIEILPEAYIVKASVSPVAMNAGTQDKQYELSVLVCVKMDSSAATQPHNKLSLECSIASKGDMASKDEMATPIRAHTTAESPLASDPEAVRLVAFKAPIDGRAFRPWSIEDPQVYTISFRLHWNDGEDQAAIETGFRSFRVEGGSFVLNGEPVFLKGISKHEDHPSLGPVQTEDLIREDLGLVRGLGANFVRLAHYPHDTRELDQARDMGFLLGCEIPLYQAGIGFAAWSQEKRSWREFPAALFGLRQVASRGLVENSRRQLARMIERDRNNPAIIFWSVGNECYTLGRRSGEIFSRLADTARFFDPDRPVTNVELTYHIPLLDRAKRGWEGMDFCCLNSYFGWYYGSLPELSPFIAGLKKSLKGRPLVLSEFGSDAALGRHDSDGVWKSERVAAGKTYSEEYQEGIIRGYCAEAKKHPSVQGLSPWVFSDFYNTWFPHNPVPNYNLKGLVSRYREPKAAYHALAELYKHGGHHEKNL